MRIRTALLLSFFLLLGSMAFATTAETAAAKQLEELFSLYNKYGQFNGAVLVARDGRVIYEKGFGYANFEWKVPNTPQTRFRIASVSKTFAATLVMQEVERGAIDLDAPIGKYVPEYRSDLGARITVRQLLSHTSGVPDYTRNPVWRQRSKEAMPHDVFLKTFCLGDLDFESGLRYSYSNCGYFLLGLAIEHTSGKKYEQLLTERILGPLGMTNTGIDDANRLLPMRGYGYRKTIAQRYEPAEYLDTGQAFVAGDIYSTVEDLLKWDQAFYGDKILSVKTREMMFTKESERTGLGWFVAIAPPEHPAAGRKLQFHEGNLYYWMTLVTRVPEDRLFVAIINNTGNAQLEQMTAQALNIVLNGKYVAPKQAIADVIGPILVDKGSAAAVAEYRRLQLTSPTAYDFGERAFNSFGYALLQDGRLKAAIDIFKLNTETYSHSANCFDSLGEAYERDGQRELAIANYEKAVKLDPKAGSSQEALKRLRKLAPHAGE
jgi:CubicO group peptidase (beta-lactamase class C family)